MSERDLLAYTVRDQRTHGNVPLVDALIELLEAIPRGSNTPALVLAHSLRELRHADAVQFAEEPPALRDDERRRAAGSALRLAAGVLETLDRKLLLAVPLALLIEELRNTALPLRLAPGAAPLALALALRRLADLLQALLALERWRPSLGIFGRCDVDDGARALDSLARLAAAELATEARAALASPGSAGEEQTP